MSNIKHTVMVTDGDSRNALCIIRALAKENYNIIISSEKKGSLSFYSKYADIKVVYPSPFTEKTKFIIFMLEFIKKNKVDLIIPVSDLTIYPIVEHLEEFNQFTKIAAPDMEILNKTFDKQQTLKVAEEIGVPCPRTYYIKEINEIYNIAEEVSEYPIVIKPRISRYWKSDKMVHGFRRFVHSKEELISAYMELHSQIPFPLIQEYIEGEGYGVFAIAKNGKVLSTFAHKRIHELPISGGTSVLRVSIKPDKEMERHAIRLLEAINWTGVAMVEFKGNKEEMKLMEVNGRFWGSIDLAVSSGVNFPKMLVEMYLKDKPEVNKDYVLGHKSRWLCGDIQHTLEYIYSNNYTLKEKYIKIIHFFGMFFERKITYDNFKKDDMLPGMFENSRHIAIKILRILRLK